MSAHRPRTPETERSRRWFMNKALLTGGVAALATMTGCSSGSSGSASTSASSSYGGPPNGMPSGGPGSGGGGGMGPGASEVKYADFTGVTTDGKVVDDLYSYRVHSPVVLIEYDAQSPLAYGNKDSSGNGGGMGGPGGTPTQQHIHTIIRTPNGGDYGVDLLKLHLENDH